MKLRILLVLSLLALAALPARANTVVEVLGRVSGTNLTSGPWAAAHVGEYFYLTYQLVSNGTPTGACGANDRHYSLIPGSFHATVHGVTLDAPYVSGSGAYLNPTCDFANGCPVADVITCSGNWASPGTLPVLYQMTCEMHDSTGFAWSNSDIGQDLGFYGPRTFDYIEWSIGAANQTSFSVQFLGLNIHAAGDVTGSCCLGDGWCAVTSSTMCTSGAWTAQAVCGPNSCPPAGACCLGNGQCQLATQAACAAIPNATYGGDNTTCGTFVCPTASGCCISGSCVLLTEQACQNSGGSWHEPETGWLGTVAGCDLQPQYHKSVLAYLPDATGTTTVVPGVFTDSITIADTTPVQSVELWLGLGMQRINDSRIRLTGPNGTTLDLVTRIGSTPPDCTTTPVGAGYTMYDTLILQDEAAQTFYDHVTSFPAGSNVSGGRYRPAGCGDTQVLLDAPSPAGFGGIPLAGTWTLTIRDERTGVQTYLNAWGLSFNGGSPPTCGPTCGSADFNCDGDIATDQDIEAFFACLAGNCPPPPCTSTADFNGDGDIATDADIEAFFRVLAGGTC
jgi:subtilisin-like proprotein convertase family protein